MNKTGNKPQSLFKTRHAAQVHFVGIGGIGMSGVAEVLINLGYRVSGSDLKESDITRRLTRMGATIFEGHKAENLVQADVVVISSDAFVVEASVGSADRARVAKGMKATIKAASSPQQLTGTVTEVGFVYDRGDFGTVTYSGAEVGGVRLDI